MMALNQYLSLLRIQAHAVSSDSDILVENFENATLELIPPPLCGLDVKFRDATFSDSSSLHAPHPPPHHIDRFGATCSLHSQEDGEAPSCQILCLVHNNALSSISGGEALTWLHFQVLCLDQAQSA